MKPKWLINEFLESTQNRFILILLYIESVKNYEYVFKSLYFWTQRVKVLSNKDCLYYRFLVCLSHTYFTNSSNGVTISLLEDRANWGSIILKKILDSGSAISIVKRINFYKNQVFFSSSVRMRHTCQNLPKWYHLYNQIIVMK